MAARKPAPWVTHERLDDEVIAINLETGAYFALDDVAADCWTLLVGSASTEAVVDAICSRYDVDRATAADDIERFIATLESEGLLVADDDGADGSPAVELPPNGDRRAYVAPSVNKFDDLEELLLLDPIHEVDDVGWPVARQ